jgi:hypothetical protein
MGRRRTGIIVTYTQDAGAGIVRTANGRHYLFFRRHWRSEGLPISGESVVFYALRKGRAAHVKRRNLDDGGESHLVENSSAQSSPSDNNIYNKSNETLSVCFKKKIYGYWPIFSKPINDGK